MVGAFPPPVHGVSAVNDALHDHLSRCGLEVLVIDLSSGAFAKSNRLRIRRLIRVLRGLSLIAWSAWRGKTTTVYLGLSGGYGQAYDMAFVLISRLFRIRVFMHHHSFAYLRGRRPLTRALVAAAGAAATHIVLCAGMGARLRKIYPGVQNVSVISNAALIPAPVRTRVGRTALRTIGFLGNISVQKGIEEFFGVFSKLAEHAGIQGLVAGTFESAHVEGLVLSAIAKEPRVQFVGPRYGQEKTNFFAAIDVLLFPSRYGHEAEPLTVHEALREGAVIICTNRGCLPGMVPPECGVVVDEGLDFVKIAASRIADWRGDPEQFAALSRATLQRVEDLQTQLLSQRDSLTSLLGSTAAGSV